MEKQERKQEPRREPQGKEEVKANPKVIEAGKKMKEDIKRRRIRQELRAKGGRVAPVVIWTYFPLYSPLHHTPVITVRLPSVTARCHISRFDNAGASG
jgi:hypothetical protein